MTTLKYMYRKKLYPLTIHICFRRESVERYVCTRRTDLVDEPRVSVR